MSTPTALTIAGSDPSGGAGLQADLKTFHQHGVYGMSAVTLLTVQNTQAVARVELLKPALVLEQIDSVIGDIPPSAAKTGALGSCEIIEAVASRMAAFPFPCIVDPVMISKHGARLMDDEAVHALRRIIPHAFLITPNAREAALLTGLSLGSLPAMMDAARALGDMGAKNVLIKGGRAGDKITDILYADGRFVEFTADYLTTRSTHGTGCVYSAAITARLARGEDLHTAIAGARKFVSFALRTAPALGRGLGPTNMCAPTD
jgi:hydroxymethylpyrimidine/phosphomethylpyrimidine kinase